MPIMLIGALIALSIGGIASTFAAGTSTCTANYTVTWGDTLGAIAGSHATTWQQLQKLNDIPNANLIYPGEHICLAWSHSTVSIPPVKGTGNYFAFPNCTWGANQEYHALHGIWVPWTTQSDAYQWPDRARDFHWTVDTKPKVGDIFVLAPWHQGAYGLGHTGVVLSVKNNTFDGTSTNWYPNFAQFTKVTYSIANGVQFIRY